jgi:hypothetical protein
VWWDIVVVADWALATKVVLASQQPAVNLTSTADASLIEELLARAGGAWTQRPSLGSLRTADNIVTPEKALTASFMVAVAIETLQL